MHERGDVAWPTVRTEGFACLPLFDVRQFEVAKKTMAEFEELPYSL